MKTLNKFLSAASVSGAVILCLIINSCSDNFTSPALPSGNTITQVAQSTDSLAAFYAVLNKTQLAGNFNSLNGGQFTVFAPSNGAFVRFFRSQGIKIPYANASTAGPYAVSVINSLTTSSSPLKISDLVTRINYHIISSPVVSTSIANSSSFVTMQGARLSLSVGATTPFVINGDLGTDGTGNGANVMDNGTTASNGIIYLVDRVMAPISISNVWDKTLLNFSINYSVTPISISMPSAPVTLANTPSNGENNFDISNAVINTSDNDYNLFSAALIRGNVATVISPNGVSILNDFTVFAPTDGAIKSFLNETTESNALAHLDTMSVDKLNTLVSYHVVLGRILSTDLTNAEQVNTLLSGKAFKVNINAGVYTITDLNGISTDATITTANKLTNAGVLHIIDHVLLSQ